LFYHLGYLRGSSEDYMASKEGTVSVSKRHGTSQS
jgi:hypothetical protein